MEAVSFSPFQLLPVEERLEEQVARGFQYILMNPNMDVLLKRNSKRYIDIFKEDLPNVERNYSLDIIFDLTDVTELKNVSSFIPMYELANFLKENHSNVKRNFHVISKQVKQLSQWNFVAAFEFVTLNEVIYYLLEFGKVLIHSNSKDLIQFLQASANDWILMHYQSVDSVDEIVATNRVIYKLQIEDKVAFTYPAK